jgi:hypothetical protein
MTREVMELFLLNRNHETTAAIWHERFGEARDIYPKTRTSEPGGSREEGKGEREEWRKKMFNCLVEFLGKKSPSWEVYK